MTRGKKDSRGSKRAAKLAKRKAKHKRPQSPNSAGFPAPLALLADLPLDVRHLLLTNLLGSEEQADEFFNLGSPTSSPSVDSRTERLLARASAARTQTTRLARLQEVVEHNPDCVDGWMQLAENQERASEAIPFYEQAVAAAERRLSEHVRSGKLDRHDEGVRTYVWTVRNLVDALLASHQLEEAIDVAEQLLEREPDDHTSLRHQLLGMLLEAGRHDQVRALLMRYRKDPFAEWPFGRLLLAIQTQAPEKEELQLLKQAHKQNPYVLDYLLGRLVIPLEMPALIELREPSGAARCATHLRKAWVSTPGALSWLREAARNNRLLKPIDPAESTLKRRTFSHLDGSGRLHLSELPAHEEPVWVVGIHETAPIHRAGNSRKKKAWILYALAPSGPINIDIREKRANARELWQWLLGTMTCGDQPGFPERIEFLQPGLCRQLRTDAAMAGLDIDVCDNPPPVDQLFGILEQHLDWQGTSQVVSDDDILALPQDPTDVWQCDVFRMQERLIDETGELQQAVCSLVVSARDDLVLTQSVCTAEPAEGLLLSSLKQALLMPLAGTAHRPAEVAVRNDDDRLLLEATLRNWGIRVVVGREMEVLDHTWDEMSELFQERGPVSLHSNPDITQDDLAAFYETACRLYRNPPWRRWQEDDLIVVHCEALRPQPVYALVMGQSGIELGVSVFDDRRTPERLFRNANEDVLRSISGYSLNFEEEQEVAVPDLDTIEQFGWPVSTPEAYPVFVRINQGPSFTRPTQTELQMMTALMEALLILTPQSGTPVVTTAGTTTVTCTCGGQAR